MKFHFGSVSRFHGLRAKFYKKKIRKLMKHIQKSKCLVWENMVLWTYGKIWLSGRIFPENNFKSAEPVGKIWFLENILFWKTLIFKNGHPKVDKTGQIIFDKLQTHQVSLYRYSMHGMAVWRNLFCKSYGTCYLEFLIRLPEPFLMGFQRKKNT